MRRATGWRRQLADNPTVVAWLVGGLVFVTLRLIGAMDLRGAGAKPLVQGGPVFGLAVGVAVYAYGRSIQNAEKREAPTDE